ncbi:PH domain-containing protein [Phytophthora cinnamomi]|uniref:PH domain-containing protein n=1 Tax=Phytophthora cinnamomi TaxID=4785 RepID=UPI00355A51C2|nr:PH domain-containing protein [Phytophthora cinnamomi]
MVGVEVRSPSAASGSSRPSEEPSPISSSDDQQMEEGGLANAEWVEDGSGFGIPDGTLQLVEVPRRLWRRPMELPLPPPSPAEAPILQEFSRPWRALRLPLPDNSSEEVGESLLKCYDWQYSPGKPTFASEIRTPPFLEPRVAVPEAQTLLIAPHIRFTLGTIEPLVCRMLVYDVSQNCRVTEEFCFRIPGPMLDKTDCTTPPAALTHMLPTYKERNLYLVLKVSKVLVGDGDLATGPYCAPDKFSSPAEQHKLVEKAVDCGMRLGRFQQPLAWGTMPLANGTKQSMTLYRQRTCIPEEQRLSLVSDAIRGTLKEKVIPALCEFDIEEISPDELSHAKFKGTGAHDTAPARLEIVDPFSEQSAHASGQPEGDSSGQERGQNFDKVIRCREVQPMCHPSSVSACGIAGSGPVAVSYINTLYIYPLQIEKCQYRNVAIRVQLLQREVDAVRGVEEAEDAVLRAVYRANNQVGRSAYALVGYHQKNPQFEDEIKICLPVSLTPEHHILFTFYHVHCKKLQPNQPQQELIGYAVLPLLRKDGTIVQDSKYTVNVAPAPVSSKPSATGGVHSQDSAVAEFLAPFHGNHTSKDATADEDSIVKRLVGLCQSDESNLRYFFFMITKFVLGYLRYGTSIVRWSAFRTLLTVIKKITPGPTGLPNIVEVNRVLHSVHIVFDEKSIDDPSDSKSSVKREHKSVFSALLETWLNVLNNKTSIEENTETLLMSRTYSNVLLQLILKSIAMDLLDQRDTSDGDFS